MDCQPEKKQIISYEGNIKYRILYSFHRYVYDVGGCVL